MNNDKILLNNKKRKKCICICVFFFFFLLSMFFPYTSDDWAWGSSIGIDRLVSCFENYNGRYLSNVLVIIMTRSRLLRSFITAFVLSGIIILIDKIIDKKYISILLMTIMLILLTPKAIFSQVIVWSSGFTNYALSIFITLIYIFYISKIQKKFISSNWFISICFLILGISGSLIMEYMTIYNIVLASFGIGYTYIKYKRISKTQVLFLIGSVIGALIMFSNGAYHNVVSGTDFYRSVPDTTVFGIISRVAANYFCSIQKFLLFDNILINGFIVCLLFINIYKHRTKLVRVKKWVKFLYTFIFLYLIYTIFKYMSPTWMVLSSYTIYFEGFFTFGYGVSVLFLTFMVVKDKLVKQRLIFYLVSIVIMCGPLLIVHPVTSRCFFPMYVLLILFVLELWSYTFEGYERFYSIFNKHLLFVIVIGSIYLLNLYMYVALCDYRRVNYIRNEVKEGYKVIEIERMPHKSYLKTPDPDDNGTWEKRFKLFYKIDSSIDLVVKE